MNDGSRMSNMRESLNQLKQDVGTFYALVNEVDMLQQQRAALNTLKYLKTTLK